jgi:hypothetical protein
MFRDERLLAWGVPATGVLVEILLDRRADGDLVEAEAAIERLTAAPADEGRVIRDILLRVGGDHAMTAGIQGGPPTLS